MKDSTFFTAIVVVIVLAVGGAVYVGRLQVEENQTTCTDKGKMYISTRSGDYCVDSATIEKIK